MKEFETRTLLAIKWLYKNNRITNKEKKIITTDIVENLSNGEYSKIEVAFLLFIGGFRPGEGDVSNIPTDLSEVDSEDIDDFETLCHSICNQIVST